MMDKDTHVSYGYGSISSYDYDNSHHGYLSCDGSGSGFWPHDGPGNALVKGYGCGTGSGGEESYICYDGRSSSSGSDCGDETCCGGELSHIYALDLYGCGEWPIPSLRENK